jgi:ABC-2 type transport system permease protein
VRRLFLIARREYFAYTRTVGFWLSLVALPLIAGLAGTLPLLAVRAEPSRAVVVLDYTGRDEGAALARRLDRDYDERAVRALRRAARDDAGRDRAEALYHDQGAAAAEAAARAQSPGFVMPLRRVRVVEAPPEVKAAATPEAAEAALKPHLADRARTSAPGIDAFVLLTLKDQRATARIWSRSPTEDVVQGAVRDALGDVERDERLKAAGVDPAVVASVEALDPKVEVFSPKSASGGAVGLRDRLPTLVGLGTGFLLWSLIMTAAGILMNSVMEEKSNRVLEVLLSSATTAEIMGGKVLGVAGIAVTVLGVWVGLGASLLHGAMPGIATDLMTVLTRDGLWVYLALFFLCGYLMYGMLFAAVGAWCETPREAQTLLGPVMMVLMIPLFTMQFALRSPDMPLLRVLSWVPFFTPFLMSARMPSHPAGFEIAGAVLGMVICALFMIWLGGKAFRAGALAGGKLDWRGVFALARGRR